MRRRVLYDASSRAAAAAAHLLADEYDVGTLSADLVSDAVPTVLLIEPDSRHVPQMGRHVRFALAQNDSVKIPFRATTLPLTNDSVAGHVALTGKILNLEDAYAPPPGAPYHINPAFDEQTGYRTRSTLVVPMRTPQGETIGVLQLINCKPAFALRLGTREETGPRGQPVGARREQVLRSLAVQAGA